MEDFHMHHIIKHNSLLFTENSTTSLSNITFPI